jgi:hypothetical protein
MRCPSGSSLLFQSYIREAIYRPWRAAFLQSFDRSSPHHSSFCKSPSIQTPRRTSLHGRSYGTAAQLSSDYELLDSIDPTPHQTLQSQSSNYSENRKKLSPKVGSSSSRSFQSGRSKNTANTPNRKEQTPTREREAWQIQKAALKKKFGDEAWSPKKRISPDALEGIRTLHEKFPEKYTTPVLADQFKISPEAVRRILRSNWRPSDDQVEDRRARWDKRGQKIWTGMSELGLRPPKKWRDMGIRKKADDHKKERGRGGKRVKSNRVVEPTFRPEDEIPWAPVEQSPWIQDEDHVVTRETIGERIL